MKKSEQDLNSLPTAAGQIREATSGAENPETPEEDCVPLDHTDAISRVFMMFRYSYHNQYRKVFEVEEDLIIAKKFWRQQLRNYPAELIVRAAETLIRSEKFLPNIASLVEACEKGKELFGMPDDHSAYVEACMAPLPKSDHQWSHPAVYYAGKATDWYFLATEEEQNAFPRFQHHYSRICQRVLNGEELQIEVTQPLPKTTEKLLSKAELQRRIAELRKKYQL